MFGKKKKEEKPTEQDTEPIKSETEEEKPTEQKLPKETEKMLKTFTENYDGIFVPQSFNGIRPDATIVNLLFAVYGELRKLNEALSEEENASK